MRWKENFVLLFILNVVVCHSSTLSRPTDHRRFSLNNTVRVAMESSDTGRDVMNVLSHLKWKKVTIITSEIIDINTKQANDVEMTFLYTSARQICQESPMFEIFKSINRFIPLDILLWVNSDCLANVLRQINRFDVLNGQQGYFDHFYKWFIVVDGVHILHSLESVVGNITNLLAITKYPGPALYSAIKLSHNVTGFSLVGQVKNEIVQNPSALFPNLKFGMNQRHLSIVTIPWGIYTIVNANGADIKYTGVLIDMIEALSTTLNFSYSLSLPPDGKWGGVSNGTWVGMVGQIHRKEVDMILGSLTFTHQRSTVLDFVQMPISVNRLVGMYYYSGGNIRGLYYINPFRLEVWALLFSAVLVAGMTLASIKIIQGKFRSGVNSKESYCVTSSSLLLGATFRQGSPVLDSHMPGRILWGSFWLFVIILLALYDGNLVASLTVSKEKIPFETFQDLLDNTEYSIGTLESTSNEDFFKYSNVPVHQNLYKKMKGLAKKDPEVFGASNAVLVEKVKREKYFFVVDEFSYSLAAGQDCNLRKFKQIFNAYVVGFGMRKNSAFVTMFSEQVVNYWATGMTKVWWTAHWPRPVNCPAVDGSQVAIGVGEIYSVFLLLAVMIGLSLVILLLEMITFEMVYKSRT